MDSALRALAVSTSVALLAVGCGRSGSDNLAGLKLGPAETAAVQEALAEKAANLVASPAAVA